MKSEITTKIEKVQEAKKQKLIEQQKDWKKNRDDEEEGIVVDDDDQYDDDVIDISSNQSTNSKKKKVFDPYSEIDDSKFVSIFGLLSLSNCFLYKETTSRRIQNFKKIRKQVIFMEKVNTIYLILLIFLSIFIFILIGKNYLISLSPKMDF